MYKIKKINDIIIKFKNIKYKRGLSKVSGINFKSSCSLIMRLSRIDNKNNNNILIKQIFKYKLFLINIINILIINISIIGTYSNKVSFNSDKKL